MSGLGKGVGSLKVEQGRECSGGVEIATWKEAKRGVLLLLKTCLYVKMV